MLTPEITEFIAGLPKVELHVHHVGAASPRIVAELAARHEGSTPVPADPALLESFFDFRDFAHFIEIYLAVVDLIREPDDLWALIHGVGRDLSEQRVRYAELTVTPYTHLLRGFADAEFCEVIEDARKRVEADFGTVLRWCFDVPGESGVAGADRTLSVALDQRPDGLISFGLGGPEIGVPRGQFVPHFSAARAAGLHSVPHAGESTGAQTVWDSIRDLGAERIGHGVHSVEDPALLEHLVTHGITLEVCPTSNIRTRVVPTMAEHPLPELVKAGVPITINSDDPPMFGTTLNQEYAVAAELLGLDRNGIADLARSAVRASFLGAEGKSALLAEIDAYVG
ncbi:adenosine deaminase [Planotetraspora kaengkrachanensis]|uniref:Aminodeoxyfutalosine deaminase n=1 Tax=Planotetraspora kaengkrachanensis TaxID=575193 RepID=A0A8J3PVB2_9ACTN|nr:adenosine deaminase [Planotetraspora kaengkrachanensis]GIG81729.1 aminodeoxyfutalosine deaminase [Planotetraspora kaengkrachanensis]